MFVAPLVAFLGDVQVGVVHFGYELGEVECGDGQQVQLFCSVFEILFMYVDLVIEIAFKHDEALTADALDYVVNHFCAKSS